MISPIHVDLVVLAAAVLFMKKFLLILMVLRARIILPVTQPTVSYH